MIQSSDNITDLPQYNLQLVMDNHSNKGPSKLLLVLCSRQRSIPHHKVMLLLSVLAMRHLLQQLSTTAHPSNTLQA